LNLTLVQFLELMERHKLRDYSRCYWTAGVIAAIYNSTPRKSRKTYQPEDFVGERPGAKKKVMSGVEIMRRAKRIHMALGGKSKGEADGESSKARS